MNFELISAVAGADFGLGCRRHARARVAGFSVSTPTPYRQICRLLLLHLHTHTSTANHLFLVSQVVLYSNILPISFDRFEFFLAPYFSHALDYRSNQSISRRFFFFSLFDNSFLSSPSPFLSFYFLSFTRVLPLTPHFDSPLYTLSLVRYDNGRGRKKKDIASRRMMAITTGSLRRQTGHGTRFPDHSFLFMFSGDDRAVDRTPEQKSISTVQV